MNDADGGFLQHQWQCAYCVYKCIDADNGYTRGGGTTKVRLPHQANPTLCQAAVLRLEQNRDRAALIEH